MLEKTKGEIKNRQSRDTAGQHWVDKTQNKDKQDKKTEHRKLKR